MIRLPKLTALLLVSAPAFAGGDEEEAPLFPTPIVEDVSIDENSHCT